MFTIPGPVSALRPKVPTSPGGAGANADGLSNCLPPVTGRAGDSSGLGLIRSGRLLKANPTPGTASVGPITLYGNPDRIAPNTASVHPLRYFVGRSHQPKNTKLCLWSKSLLPTS